LEAAAGGGSEEPFDASFTGVGLAAEGELAVEDGAAEAQFGVVVGRFDAGAVGEGRRGPDFEQVAGEAAAALVAGGFAAVLAQDRFELAPPTIAAVS